MKPIKAKYDDCKYIITHNIRICERVCKKNKRNVKACRHVNIYSILLQIFNTPNYFNELHMKNTLSKMILSKITPQDIFSHFENI